jgi:lysophospholipase L1-like esterase
MEAWIDSWFAPQQPCEEGNLPPLALGGKTLRQRIRVSVAGTGHRLLVSNLFGDGPLKLARAGVGRHTGPDSIAAGSSIPLSFGGKPGIGIGPGDEALSDTFDLPISASESIMVSLAFESAPAAVTAHPGSRTTSFIADGDGVDALSLPGAASTDHWYFISALETMASAGSGALVALGDSITDGRGVTVNADTRWTDVLSRRMIAENMGIAVLNAGLGGNRILREGLGPFALSRFDRDVLERKGARWAIVFEGINDIGSKKPGSGAEAGRRTVEELVEAYRIMVAKARGRGLKIFGATITPMGGADYDRDGNMEDWRAINGWIRNSGAFDAVIDFAAAVGNPSAPERLDPRFDCGDHLHLNDAGYERLASSIDLGLFR